MENESRAYFCGSIRGCSHLTSIHFYLNHFRCRCLGTRVYSIVGIRVVRRLK